MVKDKVYLLCTMTHFVYQLNVHLHWIRKRKKITGKKRLLVLMVYWFMVYHTYNLKEYGGLHLLHCGTFSFNNIVIPVSNVCVCVCVCRV